MTPLVYVIIILLAVIIGLEFLIIRLMDKLLRFDSKEGEKT